MEIEKTTAYEILDIIKKIYHIQESDNPTAIFKDKIFIIGKEDNRDVISIEQDYEKKDSSYYFDTPEIKGVIIKKESGIYCVKAAVKYTNANNQNLWFAKIRIEKPYNKDIQIMGMWGGSWEKPDYEDKNLVTNSNPDFPLALLSMKNHLVTIYNQLCQNQEANCDSYDPKWVKKLKKYNN